MLTVRSLAPVGVFFLIGGQVLGTQDFGKVLEQLGWYFRCVHYMDMVSMRREIEMVNNSWERLDIRYEEMIQEVDI